MHTLIPLKMPTKMFTASFIFQYSIIFFAIFCCQAAVSQRPVHVWAKKIPYLGPKAKNFDGF